MTRISDLIKNMGAFAAWTARATFRDAADPAMGGRRWRAASLDSAGPQPGALVYAGSAGELAAVTLAADARAVTWAAEAFMLGTYTPMGLMCAGLLNQPGPWCSHDPSAVTAGVCECGVRQYPPLPSLPYGVASLPLIANHYDDQGRSQWCPHSLTTPEGWHPAGYPLLPVPPGARPGRLPACPAGCAGGYLLGVSEAP